MNKPIMMLMVLIVLGCAVVDDPVLENVAAERKTSVLMNPSMVAEGNASNTTIEISRRDDRQGADSNGPLWSLSSAQMARQSKEQGAKTQSRTSKPQGPFSVDYVLEGWAEDDHRLMVRLQSGQPITDWWVDLPQILNATPAIINAKAVSDDAKIPSTKLFQFGALPDASRLIFTVNTETRLGRASKTFSIQLRDEKLRLTETCAATESDCVRLLPGVLSK
jgi:hypothetical protein